MRMRNALADRLKIGMSISLLVVLVSPVEVRADPVRLTSGSVSADSSGEDGFAFAVSSELGDLFFATALGPGDILPRTLCQPCRAGQITTLSGTFAPAGNVGGVWEVNGERQGFMRARATLLIESNEVTIPATADPLPETFILFSHFSLKGQVRVVDNATGRVLFDDAVAGSGIARLQLANRFLGSGDDAISVAPYTFDRIDYDFEAAPVPEPASLLLFATGAAMLGQRVRRRRHDSFRRKKATGRVFDDLNE